MNRFNHFWCAQPEEIWHKWLHICWPYLNNFTILLCEMHNLLIWWKLYCFPEIRWFLKQPVGMLYSNLSFRWATSQELLKVTIICIDTAFQFFATGQWHCMPCCPPSCPLCACIQPMSQPVAAAACPHPGLIFVICIHTAASCLKYGNTVTCCMRVCSENRLCLG